MLSHKILTFEQIVEKVRQLRAEGQVVVQSFGIFDIIHPGIIQHLNSAKKQGDVLVVAVVKDKDVRRGPGRPIFPENFRAENVASLAQVDYVCLVDDAIPYESVKKIQPDVFAHGRSLKERDQQIQRNTFLEEKELYLGKCRVYDTGGFSFSSVQVIENFLDIYPPETKQFLQQFSTRYRFEEIVNKINSLRDLNVLVIGDGIIDEYHYCEPMGRSAKTPLVVHRYLYDEFYAGAAFAIANHLAGICDDVHLISLLGAQDSREELIRNALKPNVEPQFFYRPDGPTVLKKRYVNHSNHQKLFEVNFLTHEFINGPSEEKILGYLRTELSHYDLVLVSDFGHGFITPNIIRLVQTYPTVVAVNTQTNAANAGYNMITKYQHPNFVCLDEPELRWAAQERFADLEQIARETAQRIQADYLIVTQGKHGSFGFDRRKNEVNRTPIFSSKVIDTIGAGDAFFSFTAPCFAKNMPLDVVSFIGNAVGALAVQIVGNKRSVEKYELLEFIHALLK